MNEKIGLVAYEHEPHAFLNGFQAGPERNFSEQTAREIDCVVRDLVHDLLTIEATGDYARAKKMLDELGVLRPPLAQALAKLTGIPTDIEPIR